MDLKIIHDTLRFYADKFQNGWFAPEELDSLLDRAQLHYFSELQPQYAIAQKIHDSLLPFKAEYQFTNATSVGGLIDLPSDYLHLIAVETGLVDNGNSLYLPVEVMNEAQISIRRTSQLIPLDSKSPVGLLKSGKRFQLFPDVPAAGTVYYLRRPDAPKFEYTIDGRAITYDPVNSVQLEWDDTSTEKILFKTLGLMGINLEAPSLMEISMIKDQVIP